MHLRSNESDYYEELVEKIDALPENDVDDFEVFMVDDYRIFGDSVWL